jgi:hypothetical protein
MKRRALRRPGTAKQRQWVDHGRLSENPCQEIKISRNGSPLGKIA